MKRYDPVQIDDYGGASCGQVDESKDGDFILYADHLAAMKELTNQVRILADRLAKAERERDALLIRQEQMSRQLAMSACDLDDATRERDELEREITDVANVAHWGGKIGHSQDSALIEIRRMTVNRFSKSNSFDPSAAQGGVG